MNKKLVKTLKEAQKTERGKKKEKRVKNANTKNSGNKTISSKFIFAFSFVKHFRLKTSLEPFFRESEIF